MSARQTAKSGKVASSLNDSGSEGGIKHSSKLGTDDDCDGAVDEGNHPPVEGSWRQPGLPFQPCEEGGKKGAGAWGEAKGAYPGAKPAGS